MQRGKAGIRVEHAQLVQMEPVLPTEQQLSLLLPYALPVPAHGGSAQQGGKHPGGDEQRQGKGRQGGAGYRRQQQAERQRDARRQKKYHAAVGGVGAGVRGQLRHLGQQLPQQRGALPPDEQGQLRAARPCRDKYRAVMQCPCGGGAAQVGVVQLAEPQPHLVPADQSATAAQLGIGAPDGIMHRLQSAAHQTDAE